MTLVRHVAEERRDRGARQPIEVTAAVAEIVGSWDPHRLERVFANLLDNAIKYSPAGGTIRLTVETGGAAGPADAPGWARVQVADEGIGIPAADLPHIFDWYRRADNAGATAIGTGLGLAGARQIVEQHGGTITAASVEGAGATFTVTLPRSAA